MQLRSAVEHDWRLKAIELQNTVHELEDQVKNLLQSEFKMYESQRRLEHYLFRVQEFNRFALNASALTTIYDLARETVAFTFRVYQLQEAHISFIGEFESFSLLGTESGIRDDDPLMQDIRHGKINYNDKVIFIDNDSSDIDRAYLSEIFNIDYKENDRYIIFNFQSGRNAFLTMLLKTKDHIQKDLPSREDIPLLLALHRMLQSELNNKIMREQLETTLSYKTKESEKTNIQLRKSLLTLQELQNDLIQSGKLAAIGEISSSIAHEINNPLFVIHGRVSAAKRLMNQDNFDREKLISYLESIDEMQNRISRIVSGLRTFSRDSRLDEEEEFQIDEILSDLKMFVGERIRNQNIELRCIDESEGVLIKAKKVEFSQLMINLVSNAIDAISLLSERWIEIKITNKNGVLKIKVCDSGQVSEDEAVKIFKPFYTTKPSGKGTGLGLSISRRIIESYGGALVLDLQAKHTSFIVTFPLAR